MVLNLMLGEDGKYEVGLLIPQCYWISLARKMANYTDDSCVCQQLGVFFGLLSHCLLNTNKFKAIFMEFQNTNVAR